MSTPFTRRSFVAGGLTAAATLGDFAFLQSLPVLSAADVESNPKLVQFSPDIEPLVRLIETTPRNRLLEEIASRIHKGTTYQELLSALMLAGVRGIQPRPVGFKFHAVLVVNSAHLATLASQDRDRWLPLFWSLDNFKEAQEANRQQGDWRMPPVKESEVPPAHKAKQRFVEAMDAWDEDGADAAVTSLVRNFGAIDVIEQFWRYGARDFRDIGHKAIYVAGAWRALQTIGWRHAEPIMRSLAYALLDRGRDPNPAKSNLAADIPGRENLERLRKIRKEWRQGKPSSDATRDLLAALRSAEPAEASAEIEKLLNKEVSPASIWDGLFLAGGELLMRQPGIIALHALTTVNALHFAAQTALDDEARRFATLQAAAFVSLFRRAAVPRKELRLDRLEPVAIERDGKTDGSGEILAGLPKGYEASAGKVLSYLSQGGSAERLMAEARRLIFLKGTNSHDYKFSSAVLEDYYHVSPAWRAHFLASSMANLRGSQEKDNSLVTRARGALKG